MRKILFLFIVIHSYSVQAQFGLVMDNDGFANIREEKSATSKILQKIKSGTVLSIDQEENKSNWFIVEYEPESNGYIFHDRIKKVEDYLNINPVTLTENSVNFETSDLKVIIKTKKFNKNKHVIIKEGEYVYSIDDEEILGTDGLLPQNEFESFKISFQNNLIEIPNNYYKRLYNLEVKNFRLTFNKDLNQYYLFGTFSEGAATYDAIWVIENGKIVKHIAQINFYA